MALQLTGEATTSISALSEGIFWDFARHELSGGGLQGGGIYFDAKIRRNSTNVQDLFHAHISGMNILARALITADTILQKSDYKQTRQQCYASYDGGAGQAFEQGQLALEQLRDYAAANGEPATLSGRQKYLKNLLNRFI